MKTTFDKATRDGLIARINTINENSTAQWGKMNTYQMLKHCAMWEELISGRKKYKHAFIGRLFGKMVLKRILKDENPLKRNTPTIADLKITTNGDVESEKAKLIALLREHENFSDECIVHPFFGKMTKEQIGYVAYKHYDHHLRQFNS
jgi:hypothetical protein